MAYLVLALGAVLSICGALWMYAGYGIMLDERGWTKVIAGATMLSSGVIVMALGILIKTLRDFSRNAVASVPAVAPVPAATPAMPAAAPVRRSLFARLSFTGLPRAPVSFGEAAQAPGPAATSEPHAPPASPESGERISLVTPELQNNMLAAILNPEPEDDLIAAPRARGPHIDTLLETQRPDSGKLDAAGPDSGGESPRELQVPRFELPPVPELAPVKPRQIVTLKPQAPVTPRAGGPEPAPPPSGPEAMPDEGPAMDDWLDRAFSALDHETGIGPLPEPPAHMPDSVAGTPRDLPQNHDDDHHAGHSGELASAVEPAAVVAAAPHETLSGAHEPEHAPASGPPEPGTAPATGPAEVGRYEADGTSYIMYADGSIDAQSEAGSYRFGSMAELKAYLESAG